MASVSSVVLVRSPSAPDEPGERDWPVRARKGTCGQTVNGAG